MFTFDEIRENLAGAWMVMRGDAGGLRRLDTSVEGFWRSFGAIILVVPVFVILVVSEGRLAAEISELSGQVVPVAVQALLLLALWFLFPLIMALIARPIGLAGQYVPYIVAHNWSTVIVDGLFAIPYLGYLVGALPANILLFSQLVMLGVWGFFAYRVARTALAAPAGLAIGLVVGEFFLGRLAADLARYFSG